MRLWLWLLALGFWLLAPGYHPGHPFCHPWPLAPPPSFPSTPPPPQTHWRPRCAVPPASHHRRLPGAQPPTPFRALPEHGGPVGGTEGGLPRGTADRVRQKAVGEVADAQAAPRWRQAM